MGVDTSVATTTITHTVTATTTLSPSFELISITLGEKFLQCLNLLDKLPGGQIILRYIKSSYKDDPIRSLFELALFVFAIHYFLSSKKKENKSELVKFSGREIDELVNEWTPSSLVEPVNDLEKWELKSIPQVHGANGLYVKLDNPKINDAVLNLASNDFLNLSSSEDIKSAAKGVISSSGVGACGPPNFYGTQDVHVRLEEDLSNFLGTEQAIIYGQDFVTAGSVIPSFLKRGDLIIADSGINLAIQKALIVSRCDIEWYDHNDMDHLEQILTEVKPVLDKQKPIRRRFIVTEGLFANSGEIANLPRIVELKNKFKYRLFLDETLSIGTIGKTGKGIVEHFNIPRSEISITIGSMALSFASSGGFCVGVAPMVLHQRIQSNAYVFSASLPPYSAKVTSEAIKLITSKTTSSGDSAIIHDLQSNVSAVYNQLLNLNNSFVQVVSNPLSPVIHVSLDQAYRSSLNLPVAYGSLDFLNTGKQAASLNEFDHKYNAESFILQKIIDQLLIQSNVLITRSKNILEHENLPTANPHLLIFISSGAKQVDLSNAIASLDSIISNVCSSIKSEADLLNLENEIARY